MAERPVIAAPIVENIPDELKARRQWVCWAYEWRSGGGKWTKVPYTPGTANKARSNAASSWGCFDLAMRSYQERPDFFSGVGYMFMKDDPYVGGDIDHCIVDSEISDEALAVLPNTYAEISPSGTGIKFIARATGDYGRKTVKGELYSRGRFFTLTGDLVFAHDTITECQEGIDRFLSSLGNPDRPTREGKSSGKDRAVLAASHSQEEWAEARRQQRLNISQLLGELNRKSVNNKTGRRDTMLAYILRQDYTGFHNKWPHVGIVRGDGTIDTSQIRAVMANSIKGRGFPFPQFVALMSHFYGADCVKKWGTKQAVQEEFANLWDISRTPRTGEHRTYIEPVKRGKGSDHPALLEKAYTALEDHKAGAQAFITQQQLADALGIHRRTAITLMQELRNSGRISYVAMRDNAGIVVSFGGVINKGNEKSNSGHNNGVNNGKNGETISAAHVSEGVINQNDEFAFADAQTVEPTTDIGADFLEIEVGKTQEGVINEIEEGTELGVAAAHPNTAMQPEERENEIAPIGIYINSVSLSADTITPRNRVNLKDAVAEALDNLPKSQADENTGELKKWLITKRRVVEFVQYEYSEQGWGVQAIGQCYDRVRKQRKNQEFEDLKALTRAALEKKHASVQKEIARYERQAKTDANPVLRKWWGGRASQRRGRLAQLGWELARRDAADKERIETQGYSQGEQQEMLELVERERKPPAQVPRVSLPEAQPQAAGIAERVRALKKQREGGSVNAA